MCCVLVDLGLGRRGGGVCVVYWLTVGVSDQSQGGGGLFVLCNG